MKIFRRRLLDIQGDGSVVDPNPPVTPDPPVTSNPVLSWELMTGIGNINITQPSGIGVQTSNGSKELASGTTVTWKANALADYGIVVPSASEEWTKEENTVVLTTSSTIAPVARPAYSGTFGWDWNNGSTGILFEGASVSTTDGVSYSYAGGYNLNVHNTSYKVFQNTPSIHFQITGRWPSENREMVFRTTNIYNCTVSCNTVQGFTVDVNNRNVSTMYTDIFRGHSNNNSMMTKLEFVVTVTGKNWICGVDSWFDISGSH